MFSFENITNITWKRKHGNESFNDLQKLFFVSNYSNNYQFQSPDFSGSYK